MMEIKVDIHGAIVQIGRSTYQRPREYAHTLVPMTSFNAPAAERDVNWGPERTSILAILALVFALPCFIPGVGIIASLLAVFALVGISSSKGRVGGTGLAIAALILGLFSTALWTALGYGAIQAVSFFNNQIVGSTAIVMTEIRDGEFDKVRGHFVQSAADQLTNERLETFREQYRGKLGEFKGAPSTISEIFNDYSKLGPLMQNMKNPPQNTIPLPLRFANGPALLMLEFDPNVRKQSADPTNTGKKGVDVLAFKNMSLISPNNDVIVLIDPKLLPSSNVIELKSGVKVKTTTDPDSKPAEEEPASPPAKSEEPAPARPK